MKSLKYASALVAVSIIGMTLSGCPGKKQIVKTERPESKTVAVMPFSSASGGTAGQEAADWLALKLIEKGYVVIDRSRTTALINEKKFYEMGMTNEMRNALQDQQLAAMVFGQISEFNCQTAKHPAFFGNVVAKNRCTVSLTAKMADPATGKLLWGLILKDSAEGPNLTANELMRSLIREADIAGTLPSGTVEKPVEVEP